MSTVVRLTEESSEILDGLRSMTFPSFHHLLSLRPAPKYLDEADGKRIQPVALVVVEGEAPSVRVLGLLLGMYPIDALDRPPEILSLFVAQGDRNHGIATALVAAFEAELVALGQSVVEAVYMTGKPSIAALERILAKRGWLPPVTRTITVRFTPSEAANTPWFGRVRLPSDDYEILPWTDIRPEERDAIRRSHEAAPWIDHGLEPWRYDVQGFDTVSSLGLRYKGTVVGWVINHRIGPDFVRFTCSFMRRDLSRRGRILPLYTESIKRLAATGCQTCSLVTPLEYAEMAEFLKRRCASAVHFFGETRGAVKQLTTDNLQFTKSAP